MNGAAVFGVPGGMIDAGSAWTISFLRSIFQRSIVALLQPAKVSAPQAGAITD